MRVTDYRAYYHHYDQKSQTEKGVYASFTALFAMIFWVMYCLIPFIHTFGGKLYHEFEQNGVHYEEPTGHGVLVFLWYVPMAVALAVSIIYTMYNVLILKDIKKQEQLSWLEAFAGLRKHGESIYNNLALNVAILFTGMLIPLLSLIPNDLTNGMRILLMYFLTFLALATYGLRHSIMDKKWAKAMAKEEKKRKKEEAKKQKESTELKKKEEKQKRKQQQQETSFLPLEQLIEQSLNEKEYQLPHFKDQVAQIIQEVHYFASHNFKTNVEDLHMIERILKEEVPAVLATYEELDQESRLELHSDLSDCLDKIQTQLAARNQGRQDIKKLGAQKVIEIIKHRY